VMGFLTGFTTGFNNLWYCRGLLGFFEAGHWPCALVVTHAVLSRSDRAFGNSILQSGASIGAILTPIIVLALAGDPTVADTWRPPFLIVGAVGILWVILWLATIPRDSLNIAPSTSQAVLGVSLCGPVHQYFLAIDTRLVTKILATRPRVHGS
jgi:ACS family hexuronate transporter-like MFS transporter